MANDDVIAALEAALQWLYDLQEHFEHDPNDEKHAATLRALADSLRAGGIAGVVGAATVVGEKNGEARATAQIVAWLKGHVPTRYTDPQYEIGYRLADAIEAGAHMGGE